MNKRFYVPAAMVIASLSIGSAVYAQDDEFDIETIEMMQGSYDPIENTSVSTPGDGVWYGNDYFSICLPEYLNEMATVETYDQSINIYETTSREEYGGYVTGVALYNTLEEYAVLPSFEMHGMLLDGEGNARYVVSRDPSDVQFNYHDESATDHYHQLYEYRKELITSLTPAEGCTFIPRDELDMTSIYEEVLERLISKLTAGATGKELEEAGFGYLYKFQYDKGNILDHIGYAFVDVTHDNYPELVLGSMDENDDIVYDLFAPVNGEPVRIFTSRERDRYYLTGEGSDMIREEASSSAACSRVNFYLLEGGFTEMTKQYGCVYDAERDPEHPYFRDDFYGYDMMPIEEEEWVEAQNRFPGVRVNGMKPLSEYTQAG